MLDTPSWTVGWTEGFVGAGRTGPRGGQAMLATAPATLPSKRAGRIPDRVEDEKNIIITDSMMRVRCPERMRFAIEPRGTKSDLYTLPEDRHVPNVVA